MLVALSTNDYIRWGTLGLAGLVGLLALMVIAVGLFKARSLLWREFSAYFLSPIAYVVLVAFLFVLVNFIVDFMYAVLDPRIRRARAG